MFRSATFKLTMWYLGLVVLISVGFSVVLYHVATAELARGLHHQTEQIFNEFPVFDDSPLLKAGPDLSNGAHRILLRLIGFNIIVVVGAGFASYWLARRTLRPIEDAHEQQKRFTADVSHELRTPLTAIKMESEVALLNTRGTSGELRQTLESNLEEVSKLESLINNLLRLTRLEVSELQQNFTSLQITALAKAALKEVDKQALARSIKFDNKTDKGQLVGDHDSLVQLLVILLDNAVKYSPRGATVTLHSHHDDEQLTFSVVDEGIGIEPAALERVFDRFYRADDSRTITLTSRVGHGTTATVSLPNNN